MSELTFTKDEDFEKFLTPDYKKIKELQKDGFLDREWSEKLIKEELNFKYRVMNSHFL